MRVVLSLALALMAIGSFSLASSKNSSSNERRTIKQVMKEGHGGGGNSLFAKVTGGNASAEEKIKLLDLYIDMVENEPSKGDAMEWKMVAGKAMIAAAKNVAGREGAADELKEAGNCKACHDVFKGK